MKLSSVFEPDGPIPQRYTCEGRDDSPALRWSDVPDDVKSFVLIVDDPDAPGGAFVHWVLYDLPPEARALPGGLPAHESVARGGAQGMNDFGRVGYGGPCPPGGAAHRYVFTLSALDTRLGLAPRKRAAEVRRAMQDHVLAAARLVGRFQRAHDAGAAPARRRRAGPN
jgi:Raf kinase inhibitor-like YbhB/YbcL family protein